MLLDIGTFVAAVVAGVSAGIYAHIASHQLGTMNDTYGQIQKQTTLMRQQIVGTYAASISIDGPWVRPIINDIDWFKTQGLGLSFKNSGKVKATNFVADFTMIREALPSYKRMGDAQHVRITKNEIRPPEQTQAQTYQDAAILRFQTGVFTAIDMQAIHDRKETIEISGFTEYDNGFGDASGDKVCFQYLVSPPQHIFKNGAAMGGAIDDGSWSLCSEAKHMVEQTLRWQREQGQQTEQRLSR
jgi:hypothetical protein